MNPSLRHSLLLLGALGVAPLAARAQTDTTLAWSRVPAGGHISIRNYDGSVEFVPGSGDRVEIRMRITARRGGDAHDVTFSVTDRDLADIRVCTVYKGRGCDDRSGGRDVRVSVDYVVRVPSGAHVTAATGNGDVVASQTVASVDFTTGNGDVKVSSATGSVTAVTGNGDVSINGATGAVKLRTGNGDVHLRGKPESVEANSGNGDVIAEITGSGIRALRFTTGSGDVSVSLPRDFTGEVQAESGSGDVESEFEVRMTPPVRPGRINGFIGTATTGSPLLRMHSGSGDLHIRKGS
jgi:hypothetical protein